MPRYQVRDSDDLRECMTRSQRVMPHSTRSLAALVGTTHGTIWHLLAGKQETLDEALAQRIAVAFGRRVEDLFVPEASTIVDVDNSEEVQPNE